MTEDQVVDGLKQLVQVASRPKLPPGANPEVASRLCRICIFRARVTGKAHEQTQCTISGKATSTHVESCRCPKNQFPWQQASLAHQAEQVIKPSIAPPPRQVPQNMREWFDRVVVINLRRRADRLSEFFGELRRIKGGWPFRYPEVFTAIDGARVPAPDGYHEGNHVAACMESHRNVLRRAVNDGLNTILVLEDDATFSAESFVADVERFLNSVPPDWEALFVGNQNLGPFETVVANVVIRPTHPHRMHAYALRGRGLHDGYKKLASSTAGHADAVLGHFLGKSYRVYAPFPPAFVGQRAGTSDLLCRRTGERRWM